MEVQTLQGLETEINRMRRQTGYWHKREVHDGTGGRQWQRIPQAVGGLTRVRKQASSRLHERELDKGKLLLKGLRLAQRECRIQDLLRDVDVAHQGVAAFQNLAVVGFQCLLELVEVAVGNCCGFVVIVGGLNVLALTHIFRELAI